MKTCRFLLHSFPPTSSSLPHLLPVLPLIPLTASHHLPSFPSSSPSPYSIPHHMFPLITYHPFLHSKPSFTTSVLSLPPFFPSFPLLPLPASLHSPTPAVLWRRVSTTSRRQDNTTLLISL
ncbi:hypothetical protein E2C01_082718 [Portunus trituberculatus]|uniref:Uncharacterized protein n=1 Tax=Portunus trituberculatus TaxID=210409 RepID=A0A5B7IZV4_PORTR|nr:hypothetical protein [Portunus trituberculatus]